MAVAVFGLASQEAFAAVIVPFFKETGDWALEDSKGKSIDKVREIRDEIERRAKS